MVLKKLSVGKILLIFCCLLGMNFSLDAQNQGNYAIVIHGGAGTITRSAMSPEREKEYTNALNQALNIGEEILKKGGKSIDAVEATIRYLEDHELFNAGKGAVFTSTGQTELDASIMHGRHKEAGAVGSVSRIKNPITLARAVMENSEHVFLIGKGAEHFAKEQNHDFVGPEYFRNTERWRNWNSGRTKKIEKPKLNQMEIDKKGTVGCVALDQYGDIVAGTSTGGMSNKKYGRIGDSPVIGAGTYANNESCGVSATGHGEYFIRFTVARDIAALMEYKGWSLDKAAHHIVNEVLVEKGGEGGIIALDHKGNISMTFNSEGMYRAYAKPGEKVIAIYKENE
jgi:L-asparaginase / beta-aspartyl-peptidase